MTTDAAGAGRKAPDGGDCAGYGARMLRRTMALADLRAKAREIEESGDAELPEDEREAAEERRENELNWRAYRQR